MIYLFVALASLFALAGPNLSTLWYFSRLNAKVPVDDEEKKPETIGKKSLKADGNHQHDDAHFPTAAPVAPETLSAKTATAETSAAPDTALPVIDKASVPAPVVIDPLSTKQASPQPGPTSMIPTLGLDLVLDPGVLAAARKQVSKQETEAPRLRVPRFPVMNGLPSWRQNPDLPAVFRLRPQKRLLSNPLSIPR